MPVIKLTPELLEQGADKLVKANELNEDVVGRLDGLINGLNADWEGDAYNAFKQSYDNKRKTFVELSQHMEQFVLFLRKFASVMREEEKRQTSAAINL